MDYPVPEGEGTHSGEVLQHSAAQKQDSAQHHVRSERKLKKKFSEINFQKYCSEIESGTLINISKFLSNAFQDHLSSIFLHLGTIFIIMMTAQSLAPNKALTAGGPRC